MVADHSIVSHPSHSDSHLPMPPSVQGFYDQVTQTWSYVVWKDGHPDRRCAVIDSVLDYDPAAGRTRTDSADRLITFIQHKNLILQWILETHVHADHLTAAAYLKTRLGGQVGISKHILSVLKTWQNIFHNADDTPDDGRQFDYLFSDDEVFTIGPLQAQLLHTPGHTPADSCYRIGDALFTGDTIFMPDVGTGRCDFPGGSAAQSYESIQRIFNLPLATRIFVGHDYPPNDSRLPQGETSVAEERQHNIRVKEGISKEAFIAKREADDRGKAAPALLLPSIQVNLRAGGFGKPDNGIYYLKIPLNII